MNSYFLLDWFKRLDNTTYSKIVVIFGAVESSDNQIDNAKMVVVSLFFSFCHFSCFLLLSLKPLHDFLSFFIFVDHDIADAEVGNNNSSEAEHVICVFIDDGLIVSDSFVVSLKDKEDMGYIQLPDLMVCTELCALSEQLFHNWVVFLVPVDLGLRH